MIKKFLITALTLIISTFSALSDEFIGVIGVAVGEINNQKNEKLLNGSKIFYGDTIIVKSKSNAQILFLDETVLTVGENTELTIDDFIYDPKTNDTHVEVGESKQMEAMSLKKLQRKLDPKKKYHIEYRNKKNNYISRTIEGRDNGWSS